MSLYSIYFMQGVVICKYKRGHRAFYKCRWSRTMRAVNIRVELGDLLRMEELNEANTEQFDSAIESIVAVSLQTHFDFVNILEIRSNLSPFAEEKIDDD